MRSFEVKALLARHMKDQRDFRGNIEPEHGGSFFLLPQGAGHIEVAGPSGALRPDANSKRELAMASAVVTATRAAEARLAFETALTGLLDRLSYLHAAPARRAA